MGVPPICPLEQGCPHRHPNTGVLSPHEDGCPFGTHMGTHEHGCPFGPTHEHGCPFGPTNMGVPTIGIHAPRRARRWVSLRRLPNMGVLIGTQHGCPQRDPNMGVLSANKYGCPLDAEDGCPFRTDRGVSQRSTNMGVPWHPSVSPGTHRFGLFFSAGGCPWRRRIFPQPLGGGSA